MQILGVRVAVTNMERVTKYIQKNIEKLRGKYITLCNVHTTVMAHEDGHYRKVQNSAFIVLPDGKPLSIVYKLRGHRKAEQVAGPDLMKSLWLATSASDKKAISHYFYGGSQETIDRLEQQLKEHYDIEIAGLESPPFRELTQEEDEEAIRRINASGADIVWVGLGAPKQEEWMYAHRDKINALMIGVGAGFDFHAGTVKRAPEWMKRCCLEWLYRLTQDPKRLWKRYVVTNTKFIYYVLKEYVCGRYAR